MVKEMLTHAEDKASVLITYQLFKESTGFHEETRQGKRPYQWRLQDSSALISQGMRLHDSLQR